MIADTITSFSHKRGNTGRDKPIAEYFGRTPTSSVARGWGMVEFYETYSSLEFKRVSELFKLHEFVQMPSAQIRDVSVQDRVPIGGEKVPIGNGNMPIADGDVPIEGILLKFKLPRTTSKNIVSLYARFRTGGVFGRKHIVQNLSLKDRAAGKLIVTMSRVGLIVPVSGQGKGRYRFASTIEIWYNTKQTQESPCQLMLRDGCCTSYWLAAIINQ